LKFRTFFPVINIDIFIFAGILHEDSIDKSEISNIVKGSTPEKHSNLDNARILPNISRTQYENVTIEPPTILDLVNKLLTTPVYENVSFQSRSAMERKDSDGKISEKLSANDQRVIYSSPRYVESGYKITTLDYVPKSKRTPIQVTPQNFENKSEMLLTLSDNDRNPNLPTEQVFNNDFKQSRQSVQSELDTEDIEEMFDGVINIANEEALLNTVTDSPHNNDKELLHPMIDGYNEPRTPVPVASVPKVQQSWNNQIQKKTVGDKTYELMGNDEGYVKISRGPIDNVQVTDENKNEAEIRIVTDDEKVTSGPSDLKSVLQLAKVFQSEAPGGNEKGLKPVSSTPLKRPSSQMNQKQSGVLNAPMDRQSSQTSQRQLVQSVPMNRRASESSKKQLDNHDEINLSKINKPKPLQSRLSVGSASINSDISSLLDNSRKQGIYVVNRGVIEDLSEVPGDLTSLGVDDVAQCLRLLNMDSHVSDFRQSSVDGPALLILTESSLQKRFQFNAFNASKLMRFVRGWRP